MHRRRFWLVVLEAGFLAGLAALAAVAHMRAGAVAGVMAFGWVVVALLEWASWLDRPHYGRGLPPRFYVPQVSLPPALPADEARARLPGPRRVEDAETWIEASPSWAASLDEWPVVDLEELGDDTLLTSGLAAPEPLPGGAPGDEPLLDDEQPALDDELTGDDTIILGGTGEDTELAPALALPGEELGAGPPEPPHAPGDPNGPASAAEPPGPDPDAAPALAQREAAPREPAPGAALREPPQGSPALARHRVDPFAAPTSLSRRRAGRRRSRAEESGFVELPARPPADRPPPAAPPPDPGRR